MNPPSAKDEAKLKDLVNRPVSHIVHPMKSNSTHHDATMGIGTSTGTILESDLWFAAKYGKHFSYWLATAKFSSRSTRGSTRGLSLSGLHGGG